MDALRFFVIAVCIMGLIVYACNTISTTLGFGGWRHANEYDRIKEYILNDSPLQGNHRPILWVHTTYEVNARNWKTTGFRNNSDLNQAYLVATVQSIVDTCGDDFHICLIDDASFATLIPTWSELRTHDIVTASDPQKTYLRELGMLQLLYFYGGIRVPNSFLCLTSLKPMFDRYLELEADRDKSIEDGGEGVVNSVDGSPLPPNPHTTKSDRLARAPQTRLGKKTGSGRGIDVAEEGEGEGEGITSRDIRPFVAEIVDRSWGPTTDAPFLGGVAFVPTTQWMGSLKHSNVVKRWATLLQSQMRTGQFSSEIEFNRTMDRSIRPQEIHRIDGRLIGTRCETGEPITLDQMLDPAPLGLAPDAYGIWIPEKTLVRSTKNRWFAHLTREDILEGPSALSALFRRAQI